MIYLDHKHFEKLGGPILNILSSKSSDILGKKKKPIRPTSPSIEKRADVIRSLRSVIDSLFGPTERSVARHRMQASASSVSGQPDAKRKRPYMRKVSKLMPRPKVVKTGLRRAKQTGTGEGTSHSMVRAIERSKNPKKVLTEVRKTTEPIYAGGNTAANIRGVIRSEEKSYRKQLGRKIGKKKVSRLPKIKSY